MSNSSTNSIMPCSATDVKGLLDQAQELASKGYPVFPLRPNSKEPASKHGLRDATTDPKQIRQWWSENPDYNIGIAAPELLVVDLDAYKPEATQSKEKLFGAFVPPEIPVVSTPSGGFHYYLRVDPKWAAEWGIGNNVDLLPGLDLKGCGKGYVVAPGSAVDGKEYKMAGGWTELPVLDQLPLIPEQARQAIEDAIGRKRPNNNGARTTVTNTIQQILDNVDASELVEALLPVWQPGRRQELALATAGVLRRAGYSESFALEVVERLVEVTADTEPTKRLDAVKSTYSKPIEQIAGWSLLLPEERDAMATGMTRMAPFHSVRDLPYEQKSILRAVAAQMGLSDARYNVVQHRIECQRSDGSWRALHDGDISAFAFVYIEYVTDDGKQHRIKPGKERVYDAVCAYAYKNEYNPIAHLLIEELPGWDGRDRIGQLAQHLKHSMPTLPNGADPVETFLRKWLVGAVARALVGEQNFVIILIGSQGIGKSQLARWLAPKPDLFSDAPIDPDSRESVVLAGRVLVHELAELGSTTRRKDVDALKRFLSASTTDVRLPYARTSTCIRHRASYMATANEAADLLRDSTGNRRFVALPIDSIDWAYAQIDKQQLWAQAVALFEQGWDYKLTDEEKEFQTNTNAKHEALRSGSIGDIMLELLDNAVGLWENLSPKTPELSLLPTDLLAREYLRMIGAEDGSMAAVEPIGEVSISGEIAIWASQLANLAARVIRGGDAHRYAQEINAMANRVGGKLSQLRYINGVRRRCVTLTIEQAQALIEYLS